MMMKYLFDSDAISLLYNNDREEKSRIVSKFRSLSGLESLYVSILTLFELEYSIANTTNKFKQSELRNMIEHLKHNSFFSILSVNPEIAYQFGILKAILNKTENISRENIKKYNIDLIIAGTALHEKCTIISGDAIYSRLAQHNPDLQVECWW